MSLSKKKDSPYWYTRFTVCGIRVQESTRYITRKEAQEYEDKRKREIRDSLILGKRPVRTWIEAKARWLEEMQHKRSIHADISHFDWLESHLDNYRLDEITKDILENIAKEKEKTGVTMATVNRTLALIRSVLNRAMQKWEWLTRVPHIQLRREDNLRTRWLTREEAERLLSVLPLHLEAMAKFTLATGLRAANVSYLKWSQVDMVNRHVVIPASLNKTGKHLGVPLNQDAVDVLMNQLGKHHEYVFVFRKNPVCQLNTKAWRNALKKAGIENFRWHDLRHTWASWHVQNGTSLQELCELGGWSSKSGMQMVLRYAHLSSLHLKRAADRLVTGAKVVKRSFRVVGGGK